MEPQQQNQTNDPNLQNQPITFGSSQPQPQMPPNPGVVPPTPVNDIYAPKPKKTWKKVLIVLAVLFGAFIMIGIFAPAPPEESTVQQLGPERAEPSGTKLETFAEHKVTLAVPEGWIISDTVEIQNAGGVEESEKNIKKYDFLKLYYDSAYEDSLEYPSVSIFARGHGYVSDDIASDRLDDFEDSLSNANGHKVAVTKEKVKVGKNSKYDAFLYSYEDTFDKTTTEKLKYYRLYVAAHGKNYYSYGQYPVTAAAKYDALVKASVLSINPDE